MPRTASLTVPLRDANWALQNRMKTIVMCIYRSVRANRRGVQARNPVAEAHDILGDAAKCRGDEDVIIAAYVSDEDAKKVTRMGGRHRDPTSESCLNR